MFSIFIVNVILLLRTWAIWGKSRIVLWCLATLLTERTLLCHVLHSKMDWVLQLCTIAQGGATIYADIGTYLPSRVYLHICVPGRTDRCALVVRSGCSAGLGNFHSLIVPADYPVPGNVRPCATNFEKTDVLYAIWVSSIVWDTGLLFTLSSFIA